MVFRCLSVLVLGGMQEQVKTEAYEMEVACWLNLAASFARLNRPVFVLFPSFSLARYCAYEWRPREYHSCSLMQRQRTGMVFAWAPFAWPAQAGSVKIGSAVRTRTERHFDDVCPARATAFAWRQEKVMEACDRVLALAPTNKKAAIRRQRAVRRMV